MYEKVINLILKKCPSKCTTFFLTIQKIQRKNVNSLHKNGSERLKKKEKLFCYFVFLCLNFSSFQTKSYFRVDVKAILQAGYKIQLAGKDFKIYSKYIFLNYP